MEPSHTELEFLCSLDGAHFLDCQHILTRLQCTADIFLDVSLAGTAQANHVSREALLLVD